MGISISDKPPEKGEIIEIKPGEIRLVPTSKTSEGTEAKEALKGIAIDPTKVTLQQLASVVSEIMKVLKIDGTLE